MHTDVHGLIRRVQVGRLRSYAGFTEVLLASVPGLVVCLVMFRAVLDPRNVDWLFSPSSITFDTATSALGWLYFSGDDWHWPLASNPDYGGNIANSLIFTDSVPVFAVPLKLVFQALGVDGPTQIVGIGLLICLLLQSMLGYALVRTMGRSRSLAVAGAALFCLAPVLVRYWSIVSLFWQWPILAGLLMVLRESPPSRRIVGWCFLLVLSTGITPYLSVMLLALAFFDCLVRGCVQRTWRWPLAAGGAMLAATFAGLYVWGTFSLSPRGAVAEPLGKYSASGLSLVDSGGYSTVFKDVPGGTDNGYGYLGLGVIVILLLGVGAALRSAGSPRRLASRGVRAVQSRPALGALALATLSLAYLSVLPEMAVGSLSLNPPVPARALDALAAFRGNGRFMWPLMYLAVLLAVLAAPRVLRRGSTGLVAAAVLLQLLDLAPVYRYVSQQVDDALAAEPRFQQELAAVLQAPGVDEVEVIPAYPHPPTVPWREIGLAAHTAGLPLRSLGYFNRYDVERLIRVREQGTDRLRNRALRTDTVYVVSRPLYVQFLGPGAGATVLLQMDDWLVVRAATAVPGTPDVFGPQAAAAAAPVSIGPAGGFSARETDATGRSGYWMTAPRGELKVTGTPSSLIDVSLTLVPTPCGPVSGTAGGQPITPGARMRVAVRVGADGTARLPVTVQSSPCRLASDSRTLYVLVYDPAADEPSG